MIKHALRTAAVAAGALVTVAALAVPAAADTVPEGCVGTIYYACTGDAQPPYPDYGFSWTSGIVEVPVRLKTPDGVLVPGMTIGGQPVGGVVVGVGGEIVPGTTILLGGPIGPTATAIVSPVNLCLFVTCLVAGEPVVVPGFDAPVVPVVVPPIVVPSEDVTIPYLGTVPEQSTPAVSAPAVSLVDTTLTVYLNRYDFFLAGVTVCEAGGGGYQVVTVEEEGRSRGDCSGGALDAVADEFFKLAGWGS